MADHIEDQFNPGYCTFCHRHALYGEDITRVEWPCTIARLETALLARVRELEAALREYGRHSIRCRKWGYEEIDIVKCDCGLAALAGGEPS